MAKSKTSPYAYAGYTYDKEIGQYYLMARYYDPEQGVFTAIDPHSGDEENPQTMNGYNYVNNNPTMFVDLNGEFAVGIVVQILKWGSRYIIKGGKWVLKGGKWVFKKGKKFYKKVTLPKPKYTKRQLQKKWKHAGDFGVKANYSAKNAHLFESALKKHIKGATEILDTVYRGRQKVTVYIKSGKGVIVDKKGNFISGWKMTAAQLKNFRKNGTRIK
nr:colicin D domain-containing protein [Listeria immobilis]